MALPKKKLSRTRRNRRRGANEGITKVHLVACPSCGNLTRPHAICPSCGKYRNVQYINVGEETK